MLEYLITIYLPWVLSVNTILSTYFIGNKYRNAWLVSLLGSFMWIVWIIETKTWGLLPMNLFLTVMQVRNHWKWTHENEVKD